MQRAHFTGQRAFVRANINAHCYTAVSRKTYGWDRYYDSRRIINNSRYITTACFAFFFLRFGFLPFLAAALHRDLFYVLTFYQIVRSSIVTMP